jgi:hypothetical protein
MQAIQKVAVCGAISLAAAVFILSAAPSAKAGSIIKLSLGGDSPPDVQYSAGIFSTVDDSDGSTSGQQNTAVDFLDFLSGFPDITTPTASYTLSGVTAAGPADISIPGLAIQGFTGGNFFLYDPSNALLLSGALGTSSLAGTVGQPATGALFTTSVANVTGGSLAPLIKTNSLSLSISMTDVDSGLFGPGLQVFFPPGPGTQLRPFVADVTQTIAGDKIPEPSTAILAALAGVLISAHSRRRT